MIGIETHVVPLFNDVVRTNARLDRTNARLDRIDEHLIRIEQRLELVR